MYLKSSRMIFFKNQHLLFYDDFGKIDDFLPNFRFSRVICRFLKSWKTDKLKKNIFLETDKLIKIIFNILKYALECQINAIFRVKFFWLLGQEARRSSPDFIGPFKDGKTCLIRIRWSFFNF